MTKKNVHQFIYEKKGIDKLGSQNDISHVGVDARVYTYWRYTYAYWHSTHACWRCTYDALYLKLCFGRQYFTAEIIPSNCIEWDQVQWFDMMQWLRTLVLRDRNNTELLIQLCTLLFLEFCLYDKTYELITSYTSSAQKYSKRP